MPWYVQIKKVLKKILPTSIFSLILKTWRLTIARFITNSDVHHKYTGLFLARNPAVIHGGPFAGMKYVEESAGSTYLLKLIGCYEAVLHPTITRLQQTTYDTIIDIGCAEGYYLIGLGKDKPNTKLIGYDIDPKALTLTETLAKKNNLTNELILDSECTATKLESQITDDTLIICDAEGFEMTILDPAETLALNQVKTILVETHEFAVAGVTNELRERFEKTHTIETLTFTHADPSAYPFLNGIENKKDLYLLLRERGEQEQQWLLMHRK